MKEQAAFVELYDQYSANIYGILTRILKREELAADALQETFTKAWRKIHTYDRSKGTIFTWVLNIARNHAIDMLRSAYHRKTDRMEGGLAPTETREHSEEMKVEHIGVREMVEKLAPELREIIEILYFRGFTQSEAAEHLEIPLGTVKSRARKAMGVLRQEFA